MKAKVKAYAPLFAAVVLAGAASAGVMPTMTMDRPGAVRPAGWVLDRAMSAKDGFIGHMDEVDEHFRCSQPMRL